METVVEFQHTDTEIGRIDNEHGAIIELGIIRTVVALYLIVEGLSSQLGMQLTGLAIQAQTIIVVDTIGDIGRLLDLGQQDATTDGMDTACREIKDIAVSVRYLENGEIKAMDASRCEFGYRTSIFESRQDCIILGLTVRLAKGDPEKISAYVEELKEKRTTSQPLDVPSAGSTFKRPEGYFAGKLIDDSGLRGFKLDESGAQGSPKHCGFVVNNGGTASAADVLRLIRYVQQTVLDKQGVKIEPEVRLIGKF